MNAACASVDVGLNTCLDSSEFGFGTCVIFVFRNVIEYLLSKMKDDDDDYNIKHTPLITECSDIIIITIIIIIIIIINIKGNITITV